MSEEEQRLRKAISQAAERGFEWFTLCTSRGDSNCPYPVTYYPQDGHGYDDATAFFDIDETGASGFFDEVGD